MKKMTFAVIGYGGRGALYTDILLEKNITNTAICDIDINKLALAKKKTGISDNNLYDSDETFFSKGKLAELLIVSTQDNLHLKHAIMGLEQGYDLLLEKPIAISVKECKEIEDKANELGRKVFVCHVLRYSPFFSTIKEELESGKYGNISTINLTENVAYWHMAHSYVRGNWRKAELSTPMIIAKCCHDLDILVWFNQSSCERVSSYGSLKYFNENNMPKGCADYCLDCKYIDDCAYSAKKIYIKDRVEIGLLEWPSNIIVSEPTVEKLYTALKTSPYGKCVYKCDNDVADHQVVNLSFKNGATAHLTMTAFSEDCYRELHVHGEKGEIYGNTKDNVLHCNIFGKDKKTIDINLSSDTSYGHGGGDVRMIDSLIKLWSSDIKSKNLTYISDSMESHYIGFAAEESRLLEGKSIKLK